MTFLPIVDRELRVAARRSGTFWSRQGVALAAILIGASIFLVNFGATPALLGQYIFMGLSILSFFYCLLSGRRSTADCLSEEKREGTLGLLFLTDLKGYDVVLGKLVATSVNSFYGLLAVFPVLAIPLLLGGVTSGEFWRVVLVLVVTFLFSLAIGMFSSAVNRDLRQTMGLNFALLLIFTLALPACAGIYAALSPTQAFIPEFCLTSPGFALIFSADAAYKTAPANFWVSLGIIHGLTWLFLFQAARIAPRSWQDRPPAPPRTVKSRWRAFWHAWSYGPPAGRAAYRKQLLDRNAYYWLAARARLKPLHVWLFMALIACWWIGGRIFVGNLWLDTTINVALALMLNSTLKIWIIIEGSQRIAEDKKIGAMELLLSTPLEIRDLIHGQFLALRRQFLAPLVLVLLLELLLMRHLWGVSRESINAMSAVWLAGIFMLVADMIVLPWVAMARALKAKSHHHAILSTMARILFLPWIGYGAVLAVMGAWAVLSNIFPGGGWQPDWKLFLAWWFGLGILADVFFGLSARRQLLHQMRDTAIQRFAPPPVRRASWFARSMKRPETPSSALRAPSPPLGEEDGMRGSRTEMPRDGATRFTPKTPASKRVKLLRWAVGLAVLCLCAAYFLRSKPPKFPQPVLIPVSLSQGPLRVFPGTGGALFILPDGSLWRWGQTGVLPSIQVPQPYGTNRDWVLAETAFDDCVGLRSNGTIWAQRPENQPAGARTPELHQIDPSHDWADVTTAFESSFAIKKDGTLWAWGRNGQGQLGTGLTPARGSGPMIVSNLTQVGTDSDWATVRFQPQRTLALKKNGTLWAWGYAYSMVPGHGIYSPPQKLPVPTQVCRETNWNGLVPGISLQVQNTAGELWEPFAAPVDATIGAMGNCHLIYSNALPNHVAFTYSPFVYSESAKTYEIRADGTLWLRDMPVGPSAGKAAGDWQRVGKRVDWVSLWSGGGTAFGLTADGTLWTWGTDPTRQDPPDFLTKLKFLRIMLGRLAASPRLVGVPTQYSSPFSYQSEPRPLLRLTPAK
jgi:hypothetical protein